MPQHLVMTSVAAALLHAVPAAASALPAAPATNPPQVSATTAGYMLPSEETYRLPLALAYGAPLSLQVASWFVPGLESNAFSGLAFVGMVVTPFAVHAAHDNAPAGLIAELGIFCSLVGGAVTGATVLVMSGHDVCEDCDDGIGEVLSQVTTGAVFGAVTGYFTWAIIDTALHARVPQRAPAPAPVTQKAGTILPSIAVIPRSDAGSARALVTGFSLVLFGEF